MKKIIILLALLNILSTFINGQEAPPQAFSYKATIINIKSGAIVTSKPVALLISILQGDSQGFTVYSEIFNVSTNAYGQVDILIGKGNVLSGNFQDIQWANNIFFLKTEVDIKGGTDFLLMSISQLLSVPYSLYSAKSGLALSADYNSLSNKPTRLSQFNNDAEYLTIETDPIFSTHPAHEISFEKISDWNLAFSWGDHSLEGYAYADSVYTKLELNMAGRSEVNWNNLTQKPQFANVALSGAYEDLIHTPEIPTSLNQLIPDAGNRTITNVAEPVSATDASTKAYVDALEKRLKAVEKAIEKLDPYGIPVDADGNTYDTVKIGTQVWMKENLKVVHYSNGDPIPNIKTKTEWLTQNTGAYCYYNNDTVNKNIYGNLYNWFAVTDSRNLCPDGWRVPNVGDWALLSHYAGGDSLAMNKLRETGTTHWKSPNTGATNEYGFTALPGGIIATSGTTTNLSVDAFFWTNIESDSIRAYANRINVNPSINYSILIAPPKIAGMSIRCIKGDPIITEMPTLTTHNVTEISPSTATSGGDILNPGGAEVYSRGVFYGFTSAAGAGNAARSFDGSGNGTFNSRLINLAGARTYYVRSYALTHSGITYGNEVSFVASPTKPSVYTNPVIANSITINSAVAGGSAGTDGGSTITSRGICWSTLAQPSISDSKTQEGSGAGNFVSSMTGLLPATRYYYCAYATNNIGTGYGLVRNFMTKSLMISIVTIPSSTITQNTATTGGIIRNMDNVPILEQGVCWSMDSIPILGMSESMTSPIMDTFNLTLTNLEPASRYYVRAYLKIENQTIYGQPFTFETKGIITNQIISISASSATGSGTIQPGTEVIERGLCWAETPSPTISGNKTTNCIGDPVFSCEMTGLIPNTNYYVRSYFINSSGINYGNEISFKTSLLFPAADTVLINSITEISANVSSGIKNRGDAIIFEKGFCWSTSQNPDTSGTRVRLSDSEPFTAIIGDLNSSTRYYVRSYILLTSGIVYSSNVTFVTKADSISITKSEVIVNQPTAAQSGAYIHTWPITYRERGICWNTSPNAEDSTQYYARSYVIGAKSIKIRSKANQSLLF